MSTHDLYLYKVVEILSVTDGDTVNLRISLGFGITAAFRFRLAGINAPEIYGRNAEPRGQEAAQFVRDWLDVRNSGHTDSSGLVVRTYKGAQATVGIGDGAFGRWLAEVIDTNIGESLGDALVEAGLAERSQG